MCQRKFVKRQRVFSTSWKNIAAWENRPPGKRLCQSQIWVLRMEWKICWTLCASNCWTRTFALGPLPEMRLWLLADTVFATALYCPDLDTPVAYGGTYVPLWQLPYPPWYTYAQWGTATAAPSNSKRLLLREILLLQLMPVYWGGQLYFWGHVSWGCTDCFSHVPLETLHFHQNQSVFFSAVPGLCLFVCLFFREVLKSSLLQECKFCDRVGTVSL